MSKQRIDGNGRLPVDSPLDLKKYAYGIDDPELVVDYDPLFSGVLGTSVSRRDLLKLGGAAAS